LSDQRGAGRLGRGAVLDTISARPMHFRAKRARGLRCLAAAAIVAAAPAAAHPLDALSGREIAATVAILRAVGDADRATRFALIDLDEPPKAAVRAWRPGMRLPRLAFVIARRGRRVYRGVVDLADRRVARWRPVAGVQSSILVAEWGIAQRATKADPAWRAAMRKRGYGNFADIFCSPLPAGYVADPQERGRRLLKMACYDTAGARNNVWGRPIAGLYALVDVDAGRVVRLSDSGAVPVAPPPRRYAGAAPQSPHPGPPADFTVAGGATGGTVRWRDWSFHFRMDQRAGLVLSLLRYRDRGRERLVLYRGALAEMFVPYMDEAPGWAGRSYMDVGEFGFGLLASQLAPGIDCPADARFFDAVLPDGSGRPARLRHVVCLFERGTGAPLWRHAEIVDNTYAGRPARELVLRMIATLGNYDYIEDWALNAAGVLRIAVGATGIDAVTAAHAAARGTPVAPGRIAVNHDHFLSFRLDVDIDGPGNTFVRERLVRRRITGPGGRRSLWTVVDTPVGREGPVVPEGAELWRIVNPTITTALGRHPGYELRPGSYTTSLLSPDDRAQRRARFSAAPLWVTAYDPRELYAAGTFPNQSRGGGGLPAYVAKRRPVAGADLVLWVTMGFHHVPRPEDWPVMATRWQSVALVPDGFFDHNPAVALRPSAAAPGR
jgi:primary-amine oxidase